MSDAVGSQNENVQIVRASEIADYMFCPHAYLLDGMIKEQNLPMSGFMAKKYWLKHAFQNLLPGEDYVGPDLTHIELVPQAELQQYLKYKSSEKFGRGTLEGWRRHVIANEGRVHNRGVVWLYHNQWWKAAHEIKQACENYYRFILRDGLPIKAFTDHEVAFDFRGTRYATRFGFVKRKDLTIGEFGTKKSTQRELDNDWAVTLDVLAFSALAGDEQYRMNWDIPETLAKSWQDNIGHEASYKYYCLSSGQAMHTRRSEKDIEPMLAKIEPVRRGIASGQFEPNYESCSACRYNVRGVDKEPVCKKRNPKVQLQVPMGEHARIQREKEKPPESNGDTESS